MSYDLLIISGCTGVGKTSLSLDLAKYLNIEIISADSMQIYKGLDIGTSKLTKKEMQVCPHHMINIISPFENYNVFNYVNEVKKLIPEIISRKHLPVIVGGTGLYIESLLKNYSFNGTATETVDYNIRHIHIYRDRNELYKLIDDRVDEMIEKGLVNEVQTLHEMGVKDHFQCMQAIGYKEICAYLNNEIDLQGAINLIKKNSRNYAKRQITWFRHMDCERIEASQKQKLLEELCKHYNKYKK